MYPDVNQQDIELLNNDPFQLIINHQRLIDFVIHSFIKSGRFKFEEFEEIKQQINEELLKKVHKIQDQFQGKSLLKTYLTVIVRNICNELLRKKVRLDYLPLDETITDSSGIGSINCIVFEEEMIRLKKAVELFYKQKWRILLCLKLRFKMPFDHYDFLKVETHITFADFKNFVQQINPYQHNPDAIILNALTELLNKYDNKNNTPDALRKWIKLKIKELIEILNGNPPSSSYTEETFQILFEKCYCEDKQIVSKIY